MSVLKIFSEHNAKEVEFESHEPESIAKKLAEVSVRFEQWQRSIELAPGADPETVQQAYKNDIDALVGQEGYQTVDVISLSSDHPDKETLRTKFLDEHTHSEDEVRFFVGGEGLFSLHIGDKVFEVLCKEGDLISVPANTKHWFDMGPNPNFIAIRFFNNPEG